MTAPQFETVPARYYVATYGDGGLEIEFFTCPLEYGRAVKRAEDHHARGYDDNGQDIDTYTMGDCTLRKRIGNQEFT